MTLVDVGMAAALPFGRMAEQKAHHHLDPEKPAELLSLLQKHFGKLARDLKQFNEKHEQIGREIRRGARRAPRPTF